MSDVKRTIAALRKIRGHENGRMQGGMMSESYCALEDLRSALRAYVQGLEEFLEKAYEERCRREHWIPAPLTSLVLGPEQAKWLQVVEPSLLERQLRSRRELQALAAKTEELDIRLVIQVRSDGVAVICDFLSPKSVEILIT